MRRKYKRKKNKLNNIKLSLFKIFIILLIVLGFIYIFNKIKKEKEITDNNIDLPEIVNENKGNEKYRNYPKEKITNEYKGYEVCAKLEIPTISLKTYVLSDYSSESLNISVVKFYGTNPNEYGNFCIAGHNFINKNMFSKLKYLNKKDKIIITDNKFGKIEYEIYDIYKVDKENTNCLISNKNIREVTLITCTDDSKKRIIIKAKEEI